MKIAGDTRKVYKVNPNFELFADSAEPEKPQVDDHLPLTKLSKLLADTLYEKITKYLHPQMQRFNFQRFSRGPKVIMTLPRSPLPNMLKDLLKYYLQTQKSIL